LGAFIKSDVGKFRLDIDRLAELLDAAGIQELQITRRHVLSVARLPLLHRDPFDRLLVAQANAEIMRLVTNDPKLAPYSDLVVMV